MWQWIIVFVVLAIIIYIAANLGNTLFQGTLDNNRLLWFYRIFVRKHEKAILLKEGDFVELLLPGTYWKFDPMKKMTVEHFNLSEPLFEGKYLDLLRKNYLSIAEEHLVIVDLADNQLGLLYQDNKLKEILSPSVKKAYWKGLVDSRVEILDVEKEFEIPADKFDLIVHLPGSYNKVLLEEIKDHEVALLFVNNAFNRILESGMYAFWKIYKFLEIKHIDMRLQPIEVQGQEIMTNDKVTLRINLSANYKVTDPVKVVKDLVSYKDHIYRELQFSLRETVGGNSLDELLSKKEEVNKAITEYVAPQLAELGIELQNVGIKDIILPGDMRELMNQVVEAEKQAQANLIRRREETAATRSLANTSKMMENNPLLVRLKELETLERITEKIDKVTVLGGLDGLLNELVKLRQ